jgi:hypothetical protein
MKFILLISALLSTCFVYAQNEKETFYLFDNNWNGVQQIDKATYLMHVVSQNDTLFIAREAFDQRQSYCLHIQNHIIACPIHAVS